jgi:hypothetical protein
MQSENRINKNYTLFELNTVLSFIGRLSKIGTDAQRQF